MTRAEWRSKYYPIAAHRATETELTAAEHSLKKWRGYRNYPLIGPSTVPVGSSSCALCMRHTAGGNIRCEDCVLTQIRGGISCHEPVGPYRMFTARGKIGPMIDALERAVRKLKR